MTNGLIPDWFRSRADTPLEAGSVAFLRVTPADWLAAGVLTANTPLKVERVAQRFATVSRLDGHAFGFAGGPMSKMMIPVSCLSRKADYPH